MIAALGETTGGNALEKQYKIMLDSSEGTAILKEKPRINTRTIDLDTLRSLPPNTFGYTYVKFLDDNVSIYLKLLFFKIKKKLNFNRM